MNKGFIKFLGILVACIPFAIGYSFFSKSDQSLVIEKIILFLASLMIAAFIFLAGTNYRLEGDSLFVSLTKIIGNIFVYYGIVSIMAIGEGARRGNNLGGAFMLYTLILFILGFGLRYFITKTTIFDD